MCHIYIHTLAHSHVYTHTLMQTSQLTLLCCCVWEPLSVRASTVQFPCSCPPVFTLLFTRHSHTSLTHTVLTWAIKQSILQSLITSLYMNTHMNTLTFSPNTLALTNFKPYFKLHLSHCKLNQGQVSSWSCYRLGGGHCYLLVMFVSPQTTWMLCEGQDFPTQASTPPQTQTKRRW